MPARVSSRAGARQAALRKSAGKMGGASSSRPLRISGRGLHRSGRVEQHVERESDLAALECEQQREIVSPIERALELAELVGLKGADFDIALDQRHVDRPRQLIGTIAVGNLTR